MKLIKYQQGGLNYPQVPWIVPEDSNRVSNQMNRFADNLFSMMRENRQRTWELQKMKRAEELADKKNVDALKLAYLNNIQAWSAPVYEEMMGNLEGLTPEEQQNYLLTSPEAVTFAKVNKFADLLSNDKDINGVDALADFSQYIADKGDPLTFMDSFNRSDYFSDRYKTERLTKDINLNKNHYYLNESGEYEYNPGKSIENAERLKNEQLDYYIKQELFDSGYAEEDLNNVPIEIIKEAENKAKVRLMDKDQKKQYLVQKVFEDGVITPEESAKLMMEGGMSGKDIERLTNIKGAGPSSQTTFGVFGEKLSAENWKDSARQKMASQYGASNIDNFEVDPFSGDVSFSVSVDNMSTEQFKRIVMEENALPPSELDLTDSTIPWDYSKDAVLYEQLTDSDWEKAHDEFKEGKIKLNITKSSGATIGAPSGQITGTSYGTRGAKTIEDININPLGITSDIITDSGLKEGVDYETGSNYFDVGDGKKYTNLEEAQSNLPSGKRIVPGKMVKFSDPIEGTIKVLDNIDFVDENGNNRWEFFANKGINSKSDWNELNQEQKENLVIQYHKEANPNSSIDLDKYKQQKKIIIDKIKSEEIEVGSDGDKLFWLQEGDKREYISEEHYWKAIDLRDRDRYLGEYPLTDETDIETISIGAADIEEPLADSNKRSSASESFIVKYEKDIENLEKEVKEGREKFGDTYRPRKLTSFSDRQRFGETIEDEIRYKKQQLNRLKQQDEKQKEKAGLLKNEEDKITNEINNFITNLEVGKTYKIGLYEIAPGKNSNEYLFSWGEGNQEIINKEELKNIIRNYGLSPLPSNRKKLIDEVRIKYRDLLK